MIGILSAIHEGGSPARQLDAQIASELTGAHRSALRDVEAGGPVPVSHTVTHGLDKMGAVLTAFAKRPKRRSVLRLGNQADLPDFVPAVRETRRRR
ncbi:MAG: hypothetical protein ACXWUS_08395 [Burkholderiales bacterium]